MSDQNNEVTVSKKDLDSLTRAKAFLDSMYTHPEHGMEVKKLIKKIKPDASIPELDTVNQITKPLEEKYSSLEKAHKDLQDRIEARDKQDKEKTEETEFRTELDKVQKTFGFTEEGMQKVIGRMKDKNNPDVEAAAAWVRSQEPKPQPAKSTPGYLPDSMNMFGSKEKDDGWKKWHVDPNKAFDETVTEIMNDPQYSQGA